MRVHFDDCTLDTEARELLRGDDPVHLSPKAFRLLEVLIDERPAALSTERLFEIIWPQTYVDPSNLPSLIKEIRKALHDDARQPKLIGTVFGHGYRFLGDAAVEATPQVRVESIAVLPFANASGPEWDYVSDGIAEALLNALVRIPGIRVVPRSTSFRYRSADIDLRAAAREMRVEAIVTGRVAARGDGLTVQAELVNAKTDTQIWGNRFHGRTSELLHLQKQMESEITTRIAEHAGVVNDHRGTSLNPEAYDHFLRGQHHLNRRDADGFMRGIAALRTATDLEPSFALAHATLAEAYVALGSRDLYPPTEIFPLAREAATRAIAIDPTIPGAHTAMAAVQELFDWDWARAETSHRNAVALQPHATAAQWFALHYARRGVHDEAKRWIDRALAIEPLSPIINTNAALVSYLAHDFASAVRQSGMALELMPHFEAARVVRGVAYIQLDPPRAVEELEEAARLSGRQPYTLSHLASAHAAAGNLEAAWPIRDEIAAYTSSGYVSSALVAISEIAVGNVPAALDALERAAAQRSPWLSYLLSEPRVDALRAEPRFHALVASIGYGSTPSRLQL